MTTELAEAKAALSRIAAGNAEADTPNHADGSL